MLKPNLLIDIDGRLMRITVCELPSHIVSETEAFETMTMPDHRHQQTSPPQGAIILVGFAEGRRLRCELHITAPNPRNCEHAKTGETNKARSDWNKTVLYSERKQDLQLSRHHVGGTGFGVPGDIVTDRPIAPKNQHPSPPRPVEGRSIL